MRKTVTRYIISLCAFLLVACIHTDRPILSRTGNAVYYWRTTFALDSSEQAFLRTNNIRSLYCRYFDVVMNDQQEPTPNATIQFAQLLPDTIEIVPTVFIMNDCMQHDALVSSDGREDVSSFAKKIVARVLQMNETNDIKHVQEIQIDCDYTARNRDLYYHFLKEVRKEAKSHGLHLSATIRLHQLAMPVPPVDYGILMLYNTGAPERFAERNPILDIRDIQPYLHYLNGYSLPMGAAYPTFIWNRTIHGVDITHVAEYDEIVRTKRLVEAERNDLRQFILTYHLDSENINRYTPEQYEKIYHH